MSVARPAATAAARRGIGLTAVTALTLCLRLGPAVAAAAPTATEQLQEVVVTAQFRQQDLETTPVAITALSGVQLDDVGRWAARIGGRYMGEDRAEEFGRRNGVPGELLVRLRPTSVLALRDLAD